jgi:hypothetical protein
MHVRDRAGASRASQTLIRPHAKSAECEQRGRNSARKQYDYRADGMRTYKYRTGASQGTTLYAYDGQMGMQDVFIPNNQNNPVEVINYGLGARGIDFLEKTVGSTTTAFFPIYDTHGSQI